ncbi:MAG TPA: tripartite tricarboxylate transporter substrate binding protein [Burkholderiales bacterium]|nr:tripartite tricarboxylate transporter substrate binding protein [Burkholderiales bacterium]
MRLSSPIALFCLVFMSCPALAQQYPTRPIRLIIPMSAGGATDILIRTLTPKMTELFGQQIVVDNRPGANGVIGDEMAIKAAPDGYTLHANSIAISINPSLYKLNYDIVRDLAPVTLLASIDLVFGVNPQVPAKSVSELIALAKAQPGKLNYASFGIGSIAHIAAEMFKQASNTQIVHVAYKSSPLAVQETIAGQTQFVFGGTSYMLPQVRAGRLRGIAIGSLQRSPLAPEIPTVSESGIPGFDVTAWFGMWVPAKTQQAIIRRINEVVVTALNHPDVRARVEEQGYKPGGNSPEAFGKFVRAEVDKFARVIKTAGIKPEG